MALSDDLSQLLTILDGDRAFAARLLADVSFVKRLGFAEPTRDITTLKNSIGADLRDARRSLLDLAELIRADIEALIDA